MSARRYDAETKAAVLAALLAGQSINSVAREYDIPKGTVSGWKRKELDSGSQGVATVATQKEQEEIGSLLLQYMYASLKAMIAQMDVFGDRAWLHEQVASDSAVLHGVQHDKVMRMIEALNRAESTD